MEQNTNKTGSLPIAPFEPNHPEMLIKTPERDKRLDAVSYCEYCLNDETFD